MVYQESHKIGTHSDKKNAISMENHEANEFEMMVIVRIEIAYFS